MQVEKILCTEALQQAHRSSHQVAYEQHTSFLEKMLSCLDKALMIDTLRKGTFLTTMHDHSVQHVASGWCLHYLGTNQAVYSSGACWKLQSDLDHEWRKRHNSNNCNSKYYYYDHYVFSFTSSSNGNNSKPCSLSVQTLRIKRSRGELGVHSNVRILSSFKL